MFPGDKNSYITRVDSKEMFSIIDTACENKTTLLIGSDDENIEFKSFFIYRYNDGLLVAKMQPESGNEAIKHLPKLVGNFSLSGSMYQMETFYVRPKDQATEDHIVNMPAHIIRVQRRRHFRIDPSDSLPLKVDLPRKAFNESDKIEFADISEGGMGLYFKAEKIELEAGKTLNNIKILFGGEQAIQLDGIVRSVIPIKSGTGLIRVGVEFVEPQPQQKKQIREYIISRQREDLKLKRKKLN